jgi:hypothetical protein
MLLLTMTVKTNAFEIRTGNVQLEPPRISEVVDLYLTADPLNIIPVDGSIQYIFPKEIQSIPSTPSDAVCVL